MQGSIAYQSAIYTIAAGVLSPMRRNVLVEVETGNSDDLTNISISDLSDGAELIIRLATPGNTVTFKNQATGDGELFLLGEADYLLSDPHVSLQFQRRGNAWYEIASGAAQIVVQKKTYKNATATSNTANAIPIDDTIPQSNEGDEYWTVNFTPLRDDTDITVHCSPLNFSSSGAGGNGTVVVALFKDSETDALATAENNPAFASGPGQVVLEATVPAANHGTSQITFKIRAGAFSTTDFNGITGSRRYGGTKASVITITEFIP